MHVIQQPRRFRRRGWIVLAAFLLAVVLAVSVGAAVTSLHAQGQPHYQSAVGTPVYLPTPTPTPKSSHANAGASLPSPIIGQPSASAPPIIPANTGILYADAAGIYLLTSGMAAPEKLNTPGYTSLVPPVLTSGGKLLYAGSAGLYLLDVFHTSNATPLQIASIDPQKQIIASMAMSADGQQVFWSVEPHNGIGTITLYQATLTPAGVSTPTLLYSQPTNNCPCYMVFGLAEAGAGKTSKLLLTDNLGTPADQGTGLWAFDQVQQQVGAQVLAEDQGEDPLVLSADHTLLAYAPTTGEVPEPTDGSVPSQVGSQPFGNSMAIVSAASSGSAKPVTIVSPQTNVRSFSAYHWITTPTFSPDNQSIAYIQFSSDDTGPYDRHSSLYVASTKGGAPKVVANFSAQLVELGSWLDSHTLLLYADKGIYALDTQTAAISLLSVVQNYSRMVGVVALPSDMSGA